MAWSVFSNYFSMVMNKVRACIFQFCSFGQILELGFAMEPADKRIVESGLYISID